MCFPIFFFSLNRVVNIFVDATGTTTAAFITNSLLVFNFVDIVIVDDSMAEAIVAFRLSVGRALKIFCDG